MSIKEKESLINSITLQLAQDYSLNIREVKAKLRCYLHQRVRRCRKNNT